MKKIISTLIISMLLILSATTIVSAENQPPIADAGGPYEGFTDEPILFNASKSYDPDGNDGNLSYKWDFGEKYGMADIVKISGKTVSHSYSKPGIYTVNLTVTDEDGNKSTASTTATIKAKPIAEFVYTPEKPRPNQDITFDASSSTDLDGNDSNLTYEWGLGDGTTKTNKSFTHNYSDEKEYTVTLTVTDEEGYNDTINKTINVLDNYPPELEIISPQEGRVYILDIFDLERKNDNKSLIIGNIKIQANATDDHEIEKVEFYINDKLQETKNKTIGGSTIYRWNWKALSTILDKGNNYSIKVIAYDNHGEVTKSKINVQHFKGLQGTAITVIVAAIGVTAWNIVKNFLNKGNETDEEIPDEDIINEAPTALINTTEKAKVNHEITLDASESTDDEMITSYEWNLGDGTNMTGETITHKYKKPGKYTVTLIVTDDEGEQDSTTTTINVEKTKDTSKNTPGFGITIFFLVITLFAAIAIYKRKH